MRERGRLNARQVATLQHPGRHADGGGLYLAIDGKGRRRWVFLYVRQGRRAELGLGSARDLPLADARAKAAELRRQLALGADPRVARSQNRRVPTFGEFADAHVETMRPGWRSPKHADQWAMTLTRYAAPLRPLALDAIDTPQVLACIQPHWQARPETAQRLRQRIEAVLDAARVKGHRTGDNPARWKGHLDLMLPKRPVTARRHHAALPCADVPAFLGDLRQRQSTAALALEFAILTAARTGEVLGATWDEIDLAARVWTLPAARMKGAREHRVPLSDRALTILERLRLLGDEAFVFPGQRRGRPLSNMAMEMQLRRMGRTDITVHGFRSSFRDWAAEHTSFPADVVEMALAHAIASKVEAAYRRGDLFNKRRELMDAWAEYCGEIRPVA